MNIHKILNLMVLTLSLATVFITLLTYLLYKIRQLSTSQNSEVKTKTEGLFFKRYTGATENLENFPTLDLKPSAIKWIGLKSSVIFFVGLNAVIFASLFFEQNITAWTTSRKNRNDASLFKQRAQEGLMTEFDLNPSSPNPELKESLSSAQTQKLQTIMDRLRTKKIILIQTSRNGVLNREASTKATNAWREFFKNNRIPFSESNEISKGHQSDLIILSQAKILSLQEKTDLEALSSSGVGVLATGPVGYLDGKGELADKPWGTILWKIGYHLNIDPQFFPTLFSGGVRAPWWDVPPGLLVNWFPTDNGFQFSVEGESSMAYEANYQGRWRTLPLNQHGARAIFGSDRHKLLTWMALDPPDLKTFNEPEQHYISTAIAQSLLWTSGSPVAQLALWQAGVDSAFVASVDSEDQFHNAKAMMNIFSQQKFPATFFVVSNLLVQDPDISDATEPIFEIATHTDDHGVLEGHTLTDQFQHIQSSRLAIEFLWGHSVTGFRPPEEGFDNTTLNAIQQNHLTYIFGDQQFHRFAPVSIAEGRMSYFPRSSIDDLNLITKNGIFTEDQYIETLLTDYKRIAALGGVYLLSLHTQVFGKPENRPVLQEFLRKIDSEKIWKTNFGSVDRWWKKRENVKVQLVEDTVTDQIRVNIMNFNSSAVENLAIQLDFAGRDLTLLNDVGQVSGLSSHNGANRVLIKIIQANEVLSLNFGQAVRVPASGENHGRK